ncbi:SGNH/GDSL hydrolase family protein [Cryobacterium frigoriphilum]|uniref:SGNH/GDSL hydrolase family protein n=1 Tax=Cryobacterium frigoriphilum TaxID=1259150 RepID=A0A4R8ZVN7_9MICO|nr:SGNH/GDSL hydrolase family protein [Cryobacterium frigoriphilum]TFD47312.1 SGNH/GDSL hydrolase family protein [Cryobacterium frigoriphilum]
MTSSRWRSRQKLTFAQWFDANVKFVFLGLTAVAVLTVAFYAMNSATPTPAANPVGDAASSDSAAGDTAAPVQVAVIGDFYTECSTTDDCTDANTPGTLAAELGWNLHFFTAPGSGYVNAEGGASTFGDRVDAVIASQPGVVIVQGGRNDRYFLDELPAAATDALTRLKAGLPSADIIVIGPSAEPSTRGVSTADIAAGSATASAMLPLLAESARILSQATEASGAELFIDPIAEGWFDDVDAASISPDSVYATPEGHAYIIERLLPHLAALER